MRIRRRQVPFPLSSSSPVPLSDPLPIHPSPVVQLHDASSPKSSIPILLQQPADGAALADSLLDHPRPLPPMGKQTDAGDSSAIVSEVGAHRLPNKRDRSDEDGGGRDGGGEKRNDTGKEVILDSDAVSEVITLPLLSPSNIDGKWCEGEKAVPPKKRRGRGGDYMNTRESNSNNNKKMKTRMKTKMNKKCTQNDDDEDYGEEEQERKEGVNMSLNASKKRGRGSGVMEGSRCSRVNGRGWRCCQQTLVGYSLCEHHLGKGRLRSITSVRSRSVSSTTATKKNDDGSLWGASSSSPEKQIKSDSSSIQNIDELKAEKRPAMVTKKRMKLGIVKARSISSLLGQTNNQVTLPENNK